MSDKEARELENPPAYCLEHRQNPPERVTEPVIGECRVMIIGRTGSGKSTVGNTLLGRSDKRFTNLENPEQESAARKPDDSFFVTSNVSGTKTCQFGTTLRNGTPLTVVDSPGWFDTDTSVTNKHVEIEQTRGLLLVGENPMLSLLS